MGAEESNPFPELPIQKHHQQAPCLLKTCNFSLSQNQNQSNFAFIKMEILFNKYNKMQE